MAGVVHPSRWRLASEAALAGVLRPTQSCRVIGELLTRGLLRDFAMHLGLRLPSKRADHEDHEENGLRSLTLGLCGPIAHDQFWQPRPGNLIGSMNQVGRTRTCSQSTSNESNCLQSIGRQGADLAQKVRRKWLGVLSQYSLTVPEGQDSESMQ